VAEKLMADRLGKMEWGDRESYLRSVIEAGERAKRELWGLKHETNACPVGQIWNRYVASRRRPDSGPSTLDFYKSHVDALVNWLPASAKTMQHVSAALAERYVRDLEGRVKVQTASYHVGTLRRVWRVLDPEGPQPWKELRPTGVHVARPYRRLSLDECRALVRQSNHGKRRPLKFTESQGCILVGYYTALRLVDVVHLRAEHVQLDSAVLYLPAPRKTSRRKPAPLYIPMLPELAGWLGERLEAAKGQGGYFFPQFVQRYAEQSGAITRNFGRVFDLAGVKDDARGRASFHSLRATFVSMMDEAGAPPRLTDIITNHAPRTMHDRYSHPDIEAARDWMRKALKPLLVEEEQKTERNVR
jgi:integrase